MTSLLISQRKFKRKRTTELCNQIQTQGVLTSQEKIVKKKTLHDLSVALKELDSKIQSAKFEANHDIDLEDEFQTCESYEQKIRDALILVDTNIVSSHADSNTSLLRSPIAPLPKFTSKEGEDLDKFLKEFEQTTSKFNYSDYDLLLLLKQQVSVVQLL